MRAHVVGKIKEFRIMFVFLFRPDVELNERTSVFISASFKAKTKEFKKTFISCDLIPSYVFIVHLKCNILLSLTVYWSTKCTISVREEHMFICHDYCIDTAQRFGVKIDSHKTRECLFAHSIQALHVLVQSNFGQN